MSRHFIFGYGSLINSISRSATGETGQSWPARVAGYERHWSVMSAEFGMSSVAVVPKASAHCNGVIVEVAESELPAFDHREQGYQRSIVPLSRLTSLSEAPLPQGHIWIYHTDVITAPCPQNPIVLSYADVIVAGCYEISAAFAQEFLNHTQGWHFPTLNDRTQPRYPRVQYQIATPVINQLIDGVVNLTSEELKKGY